MELTTGWFIAIAALWTGFFLLDGFDFGVGALLAAVGRDERGRRVVINTIGPIWDGNEVWLITAVGATFAAFPLWYATLLSAFYLPVLIMLLALVVRAVAFEYRGKGESAVWRRGWDRCIVGCSLTIPVLWGLVLGNMLGGIPLGAHGYVGGVADLLTVAGFAGAAAGLLLCLLHGATFLALKTLGEVRVRAERWARRLGMAALPIVGAALFWLGGGTFMARPAVVGVAMVVGSGAVVGLVVAGRSGRSGWAFVCSGAMIAAVVAALFAALFPEVIRSSLAGGSLTVADAAASDYTLTVLSWSAAVLTPFVLAYQAWTYWVFRRRIGVEHIPG